LHLSKNFNTVPASAVMPMLLWVEHAAVNDLPMQVSQLLQPVGGARGANSGTQSTSSPIGTGTSSYKKTSNDESGSSDLLDALGPSERGTYRNRFCAVRQAVPVVSLACAAPAEKAASRAWAWPI
jgi:hypothetical protein